MAKPFSRLMRSNLIAGLVFACFFFPPPGCPAGTAPIQAHDRTEVMIPARDGIRLRTTVYVPKNAGEPLPFLLLRTPYGIDGWPDSAFSSYLKELADDGYIFVFQDIRGRFKSDSC